ncbi:carboxy terminal-processing peptidase [Thorsellia kenyensis]|uniref:Carboxy terminal-processing peptidase n=1 Tax=Thorsellia kenyensis TaxID=1549888 RepID=A0ABV6CFH7_9GAMM
MQLINAIWLIIFLLGFVGKTFAKEINVESAQELPILTQEKQHKTVSQRVVGILSRSHYKQIEMNSYFSRKIFERYLNILDFNKSLFLDSDIKKFDKAADGFIFDLQNGDLSVAYDLYNISQQRRYERFNFALTVLEKGFDFSAKEEINLSRKEATWAKTEQELDAYWLLKVKYDALSLKLADKTDAEITEALNKRYKSAIKRLAQTNSEDVFQLVMTAFAREIDPHTSYLSPRSTEQFNSEMSLSLEGIGAVLQIEDDYTKINSLVPGGPAAKSKAIGVGDRIVGVAQGDGEMEDVIGWRLDDVVDKIKGKKGTKVRLLILPEGTTSKTSEVSLIREKIRLEDRAAKLTIKEVSGAKVAVIEIPGFYVGLTDDVKVLLQNMKKDNIDKLVIDLRSNGGGALTEAISLSGLFIPSGPVVQVRDSNLRTRQDKDEDDTIYFSGPLVVLVDRYSASASEIFAAAMQDYGRALIVGEPTFGKGTVQQHRPLNRLYDSMVGSDWPDLGSVQYTIQKFYRIDGGSTQLKGVTPDIMMPTGPDAAEQGETKEDNALPWDSINPAQYEVYARFSKILPDLINSYESRIAKNREFNYINEDIKKYRENKDKETISLNYDERKKEDEEYEKTRLSRINERLKVEGKPLLKSLEELPKDYEGPDPYLDETVNIMLDFAKFAESHVIENKK